MTITCPNCQAAYRLPQEKMLAENHNYKAHCKHCGELIHVHGAAAAPVVHSGTAVANAPHEPSWFCAIAGGKLGPLTLDQVGQHILTHALTPDDLIWRAGFVEWLPLRNVTLFTRWLELADAAQPRDHAEPGVRQSLPVMHAHVTTAGAPPPLPATVPETEAVWPFLPLPEVADLLPVITHTELTAEPDATQPTDTAPPPQAGEPKGKTPRPYSKSPVWLGVMVAGAAGVLGVLAISGFRAAENPTPATPEAVTPHLVPTAWVAPAPLPPQPATLVASSPQQNKLIVATAPQPVALVAVSAAAAPPKPTAPEPATVATPKQPPVPMGPSQVLSAHQVERVAVRAAPEVSRCYKRHAEPGAQKETLALDLKVNADGSVAASHLRGKHAHDAIGACAPQALQNLQFPPTVGPARTYTVRFVVGE